MSTRTFQKHALTIELTLNLTHSMSTHPGQPVVYGTAEISAPKVAPFHAPVYGLIKQHDNLLVLDRNHADAWLEDAYYTLDQDIVHLLQHLHQNQAHGAMALDILQNIHEHMEIWLQEQQRHNPAKVASILPLLEPSR